MSKSLFLTLLGLVALLATSCSFDDRDTSEPVGPSPSPGLGEMTLSVGSSETIAPYGLEVKFDTVLFDVRFPPAGPGSWRGWAEIIIEVASSSGDRQRVLFDVDGIPNTPDSSRYVNTDIGKFKIDLSDLNPYHYLDPALNYGQYSVNLRVTPYPADDTLCGAVVPSFLPNQELKADGIIIDSVWVEGEQVRMIVLHSGGCRIHQYTLFMAPSAFMESNPVQANLYLQHFSDDDACKALLRQELWFDLQPLLDLYHCPPGRLDPILLNIFHQPDLVWSRKKQVRYEPEGYHAPTILPMALGTYWIYIDSIRTNGQHRVNYDTVEVIGRNTDSTGDWWILSQPLLTLGRQIMIKGDSIYTLQHGYIVDYSEREYIPAQAVPVTYSMILQGDLWYERTVSLHNSTVEVPLGIFDTSYRYECEWMCSTPLEQYLVPGVGFILQEQPECEVGPGIVSSRRTVLLEHGTGL